MKTKKAHRIIAIFLTITFLQSLLPYNMLMASNNGPKAPEASSFEPVDATDMVNLVTGDYSYVLPMFEIPSPEGGYPLTLSYHAGIAMGQEGSWAGLGWNINPGALNRTVSGIPDDWKRTRKYSTIYNSGGVSTSYSVGISVGKKDGLYGAGLYASYAENKSFGGENTYNFDAGASGSLGPLTGSIGTDGFSIGVGASLNKSQTLKAGISVSKSFKNGGTTVGANIKGAMNFGDNTKFDSYSSGVGISFSTRNGTKITGSGGTTSLSGSVSSKYSTRNKGFNISAPIPVAAYLINLDLGYNKTRYWLYDMNYTTMNGSLYAGDMRGLLDEELFDWRVAYDSYQATYGINNSQIKNTNYTSTGYDTYSVSSQGLSGTIKPKLFEQGDLYHAQEVLSNRNNGYTAEGTAYYYPQSGNGVFNNSLDNYRAHFYFDNENSSFLKVTSGNWNIPTPGTNYENILEFNTSGQTLNSIVNINGVNHDGYNASKNRQRKGSYIESFKNEDIIVALNSGVNHLNFFEAKGLNRNGAFPDDGIGGFRITAMDGKTYHYSLPVYQKESFSRTIQLDKDESNEFYEESQLEPYATHWLLTAVTGPDFVDVNENYQFDENDYGYWVELEYGKWSDGFSWRTPTDEGYEKNIISKKYQWGVKEIYYLDKIKTRTHTALFIKEIRSDNRASKINIRNGNNPIVFEDIHIQSFVKGDDGLWYIKGVYDVSPPVGLPGNYYAESRHKIYVKTNDHRTLKLKKIVLLDNDNPNANISKSHANQQNSIYAGHIKLDSEIDIFNAGNGQLVIEDNTNIIDRQWNGEFFSRILDTGDISANAPGIESGAINVVDFDHSYGLMPNSPNSVSTTKGKLTLESVSLRGKSGVSLVPPYRFEYKLPNTSYNNELKDDWGYSTSPDAWSLNKITTPIGEILEINYEEDDFYKEAAITNIVFDKKFEMKFTGSSSGSKFVHFRNHGDNAPSEDINFHDYFSSGQTSRVNVQYVFDPSHNGAERVADVDKLCTVTGVTSTSVTFQLPTNSVESYERSQGICNAENYVYYSWYAEVVDRTSNSIREYRPDHCDEVTNGSHRTRIQFYSNKQNLNQNGGGIRVKELKLSNGSEETYVTSYNYADPTTNNSSGITSYAPSDRIKEVKFITELPPPAVMYEYVTVTNKDMVGQPHSKDQFQFNTLKPMTQIGSGFEIEDFITLGTSQNNSHQNVNINGENSRLKLSKFNLTDNLSAMGRLISKTSFNSKNQMILKVSNEYLSNNEIKQGITEETFKTYKKVFSAWAPDKYYLSASSKTSYPSTLKSTTTISNGHKNTIFYKAQDFLTGDYIETEGTLSNGALIRHRPILAYSKYPEMGSKVDDDHNRNMLTQSAGSYTFLNDNGILKPISVGITTWNNDWAYINYQGNTTTPHDNSHKVWRKHKTYIWDGDIDSNGSYVGYSTSNDDNFNWSSTTIQPAPWKKVTEITKYNHFSSSLEVNDINMNHATTKFADEQSKVALIANAAYGEAFYSSVEYNNLPGPNYLDQQILGKSLQSNNKAHTGSYSARITPGGNTSNTVFGVVLKGNQHRAGKYRMSVWVDKANYSNARFKQGYGGTLKPFNGETVLAGDWVQLNHYFDRTEAQAQHSSVILVASNAGTIYADDLRLHPLGAVMTSFVYNQYNELTHILSPKNLATKYLYDNSGKLTNIYQEVIDTPTLIGGLKKTQEYEYNYKLNN